MIETTSAAAQLQDFIDELVRESHVPGFLAGIWWDGETYEVASGVANLITGEPMTTDTAYFPGSITKVLTTTILMRFVDRGVLRLDDRVIDHLPELRLGDREALEALQIRHLVNHTSGFDAADLTPDLGRGEDVVRRYVELLADRGQLYPVGQHMSYSNAAFVVLGRLLEVLTGDDFNGIVRRELYEPIGMERACISADDAILHRTAIGHIVDPETGAPRATRRFMMTYAIAPAGSTEILTLNDLLRFARIHLEDGRNAEGTPVLAADSVAAMATATIREQQMGGQAFGLGWMLPPYGPTPVLMHGGGS